MSDLHSKMSLESNSLYGVSNTTIVSISHFNVTTSTLAVCKWQLRLFMKGQTLMTDDTPSFQT